MKSVLSVLLGILFSVSSIHALDLICPPDKWLPCNAELWDLDIYGNAYYIKNGTQYSAGLAAVQFDLNSCNTGRIYRTWQIEDEYWNIISCTQTIYVDGGNFGYGNIHWPESEILITGCSTSIKPHDLPIGYQEPTWDYISCSMVASSYKDQVFVFGNDCKKIVRKWTVIDWCNYSPGGAKGIYTKSQIIKVSNGDVPNLVCTKNFTVTAERCDSAYVQTSTPRAEGVSCTGGYDIVNDSPFADYPGASASGMYPIGTTKFNYIVDYACGHQVVCESEVVVKLKGPVAYCKATLNTTLMPVDTDGDGLVDNGMVDLWASDLDWGSYHECHNRPLDFSFSSDITDNLKTFTCDEVGYNTVQMWVTDYQGNQSYCLVNVSVQNNAANIPNCVPDIGARYIFSGSIVDNTMEPLENVLITAKDPQVRTEYETEIVETEELMLVDSFYNQSGVLIYAYDYVTIQDTIVIDSMVIRNVHHFYTDEYGFFGTNEIPMFRPYELSAFKSDDMQAVDNTDLDILLDFLLGRHDFVSPYSYLIADVNEDGYLTQEDYDILSDLVNGEEDEWPHERQWVFFNMSEMEDMTDLPLEDNLSQEIIVSSSVDKISKLDLMGVLKGDLTKYETLNLRPEKETELRNEEKIKVYPNPFSDRFFVSNPRSEELQISIFGLDGKEIRSYTSTASQIEIEDLDNLNGGTYLYKIESSEEIKTGKLIKL